MNPISITPSAEKGSATVSIGESKISLTTEEVDALLLRLAEVRPLLLPQPPLESEPPLPRPLIAEGFRYYVHSDFQQGGVLLHLPHPAAGWMTWHIAPDVCLQLVNTIQAFRVPPLPKPAPTH